MTPDDNHRETSSLFDVLRHVVETLQDAERSDTGRKTGSGSVSGKRTRSDYNFSVSTGPDPDSLAERLGIEDDTGESSGEFTSGSSQEYHVDVRESENSVVVLADLPRATAEGVTAGIDRERNELVIGIEGEVVERIGLGSADIDVADSSFRNGVLEVRLRTASDGDRS
ncbi:gas vesicle protein GvpH [Halalkalicoccus subterraneus]|uniref:gas vesicle protein GvpH n=1 Tax=Halalkalicoccus subterraneus TaxID=2675002 RepID=UPI000EFB1F1A|nr:gas vesicle protein GvpH [Halalkalicoccus subterraneus]